MHPTMHCNFITSDSNIYPCPVNSPKYSVAEKKPYTRRSKFHYILKEKHSNEITNKKNKKKKIWDDITVKIYSLGVAHRTASDIRDQLRNNGKQSFHRAREESYKNWMGPPWKPIPSQYEAVIDFMKDSSSFTGVDGGLKTKICVSGK